MEGFGSYYSFYVMFTHTYSYHDLYNFLFVDQKAFSLNAQ